jgi:hypothetical protein
MIISDRINKMEELSVSTSAFHEISRKCPLDRPINVLLLSHTKLLLKIVNRKSDINELKLYPHINAK